MELSTYELYLVLSSLKYYRPYYECRFLSLEVRELIDKVCVHLDNLNK